MFSLSLLIIKRSFVLLFSLHFLPFIFSEANCKRGCDLALASYYVRGGTDLTSIADTFHVGISEILRYNPEIKSPNFLPANKSINVPFPCDCLNGDFLGHTFNYTTQPMDTYHRIASLVFSHLTTDDWISRVNHYNSTQIPKYVVINVTVNCSCGDGHVSKEYGLFSTYPLRPGDNLSNVADNSGVPAELVQQYNPGVDFRGGAGLVYLPAKDEKGNFPPLKEDKGISVKVAAVSASAFAGFFLVVFLLYLLFRKKHKVVEASSLAEKHGAHHHINRGYVPGSDFMGKNLEKVELVGCSSPGPNGITVDKSLEFSYEELAQATNDFSEANTIGQGGFGTVYYAELRGEKAAVKKMDMQASKEFLAELKVLTHVHHLNLVRLIGYCIEGSLFLVYEFIENGNLGQHLRASGKRKPLCWRARVQIALDSARGLEYIHEHTVPVYIHRDIKTANILIDKNFRAKVADFGLTKLTDFGAGSLQTRLVGTFGYMSPEYAQYGEISPKLDVYAFGVVLYELISAMDAIVKTNEMVAESRGLVSLFEDALSQPDPIPGLRKLVDENLVDYPIDSVHKMAQLAKACTQENPQLRPSMRSVVVALMTLSSSTEDWDIGSFYENQVPLSLMTGR